MKSYVCATCYKEFSSNKSNSKFCSEKCQYESYRHKRLSCNCLECGKEVFYIKTRERKFCSIKCSSIFQHKSNPIKFDLYEVTCINCNKIYKLNKYRLKTTKFCSRECRDDYRRDFNCCPSCGKHFKSPKYENRTYCSIECSEKGVEKRKSKFSKSVYNFLKSNYVSVVSEKSVRVGDHRFSVDFVIGNVAIECNGDYWHCNPLVYNEEYFHAKIRKTAKQIWEKDLCKINKLKSIGYNVLSVWEKDWNSNEIETFRRIKEFIDENIES